MKKFNPDTESRVYGKNHCKSLFKKRPEDIISCFITQNLSKEFKQELSSLAKNKKAYHIVSREELEKLTKSSHHEDVCLVIKKKKNLTLENFLKAINPKDTHLVVALENVSNPHNLGAILRSMAHFNIKTLLIPEDKKLDTGATLRTSEGGAEYVDIVEVKNLESALKKLKDQKFEILATTSHSGVKLYEYKFPKNAVLLFGEEGPGLSKKILDQFTKIQIDAPHQVESINVSVAAAVIFAEHFRQTK